MPFMMQSPAPAEPPDKTATRLGANADYKRLFAAVALTFLGDGLTLTAVPWLISGVTRDAFEASSSRRRCGCRGCCSACRSAC